MSTIFLIFGLIALVAGVIAFIVSVRASRRGKQGSWLVGTVLVAAGLLAVVSGWLLTDTNPNRGEALKTGGLAAGSVVALYALWLNDRRRRTDEERQSLERDRQELESTRADHDRERVADERFARAVEMLGNEADQVRVGALHALAGLARNRPYYTQTVLDVFCSYLRRPFSFKPANGEVDQNERQVRITAQRLIANLLPPATQADAPHYDLDLTGAELEYFDLSKRVIGRLIMRVTVLHESNALSGSRVHGNAYFTSARTLGRLYVDNVDFHGKAWFSKFSGDGPVHLEGTRFRGPTKFRDATFTELDVETPPDREPAPLPMSP